MRDYRYGFVQDRFDAIGNLTCGLSYVDDVLRFYRTPLRRPLHFLGIIDHDTSYPFAIAKDDVDNLVSHPGFREAAKMAHPALIKVHTHIHLSAKR